MSAHGSSPRTIHFVINPTSGSGALTPEDLERHLSASDCGWKIHVTQDGGDLGKATKDAVQSGADVVVACGGDGTVSEVAQNLVGTEVALGILPAGTANVLALELGLPLDMNEALSLITGDENIIRSIDVGRIDDTFFLLRVGFGLEAAMTLTADEKLKQRFGRWAYLLNALRLRSEFKRVRYRVRIDGQTISKKGVTCMICNSANVGIQGARFIEDIDIADGLLHVILVRNAGFKTIYTLLRQIVTSLFSLGKSKRSENILYWTGEEITISARPSQMVARDGEPLVLSHALTARICPSSLNVLTPSPEPTGDKGFAL